MWTFLWLQQQGLLSSCSVRASHYSGLAQALEHAGFGSWSSHALDHRFSSCGPPAWLLHSMWDLSGPGIEPISLALTGGFFTTELPGKPPSSFKSVQINMFINSLMEDYKIVSYQEVRLVSS